MRLFRRMRAAFGKQPRASGPPSNSEGPRQEGKRPWFRDPSTLIAALALIVSIGSITVTATNNQSQAQSQERQQLLSLVQQLSQIGSQYTALQATYKNNPSQYSAASGNLTTSAAVAVQDASYLIDELHGQVDPAEAYQVGNVLVSLFQYSQSIKYFSIAISRGHDSPETLSAAYRGWGTALYRLGAIAQARSKMTDALSAFGPGIDQTANKVYTSLYQIPFEIRVHNCTWVRAQFVNDLQLIAYLKSNGHPQYVEDQLSANAEQKSVADCF